MDITENDSILCSVKDMLGSPSEDDCFNNELIFHINSALNRVYQLGVGDSPCKISGVENTWSEVYSSSKLSMIPEYIYLKCKKVFDPPASSIVLQAINEEIGNLEFGILVNAKEVS